MANRIFSFITVLLLMGSPSVTKAQGAARLTVRETNYAEKKLREKFKQFAKIIKEVGSSDSGLSYEEKSARIDNDAPLLFWEYPKRKMTVINGGRAFTKDMRAYLRRLKDQSMEKSNIRSYDLELINGYFDNDNGDIREWKFKEVNHHGDSVFTRLIEFRQTYVKVNLGRLSREEPGARYSEVDRKQLEVLLIKSASVSKNGTNHTPKILLGDVKAKGYPQRTNNK